MDFANLVDAFPCSIHGFRATAFMMLGLAAASAQDTNPGPVSNLLATVQSPGGTTIHLTWDSATGAQRYEVWRASGEDFSKAELLGTNGAVVLRYDDDSTRAGTNYIYSVRGINAAGAGSFAAPVMANQTNLLWAVPFGNAAPAVFEDGTMIAAGPDVMNGKNTRITAYDKEGGELWNYRDTDAVGGGTALTANGQLVFESTAQGGSLRALNPAGQLVWTAKTGLWLTGDAVVDSYGTAYAVATDSGTMPVVCAVSTDGVLLWVKPCFGNPPDHAVVGQDGSVFVSTVTTLSGFLANGDRAFFLDRRYTQREWSTPSLDNVGQLVLGSFYGILPSCISYDATGTLLCSNQLPRLIWRSRREPAIAADGNVYFAADNTVVCVATNGLLRWTNRYQTSISSGIANVPALDEAGNVYVAGTSELVVIDHDGQTVKRLELASAPNFPPVLTPDGRLFIATATRLYALKALAGLDSKAPWPMYRHDPAGRASSEQTSKRPAKPRLLPPKPFANKVRIECVAPLRPAALEIFRSSSADFSAAILITRGRAGEAFADDSTALFGTRYYYWARFQDAGGTSDYSDPVQSVAIEVPVKWFTAVSNSLIVPPAIAPDGTIYTCATNNLVALNTNGSIRWQLPGYSGSPMVSPDGALVIRSGNRICSLSPSGTTNWAIEGITAYGGLAPAIGADGRIILNPTDDKVMAVSATGSTLWQIQYTNWALKTPAIAADGSIVFVKGNTQLIILTPQGSEALSVTLSNEYYLTLLPPVLDAERTFYLPCADPSSLSATSANGSNKWRFSSIGNAEVTPVVGTDGTVFVGYPLQSFPTPPPAPGQISAIRPDGSVRWTVNSDQAVRGFLALSADGTLLVAAGTNLLALAAEDGAQIWQMNSPTSQAFGAPVLDYDGSLYVPVADGILALQLKAGPAHSAWPMFRQNPRQSACLQRSVDPMIHAFYPGPGCVNMEIQAAGGCIILESADLKNWSRAGILLPSNDEVVTWSFETTNRPVGFFRLLTP